MSLEFFFDRKGMYVYPWYISDQCATRELGKITEGQTLATSFFVIKRDYLKMYYDKVSSARVGRFFLDKIIKDKKFYLKTIENIYRYSAVLQKFSDRLNSLKDLQSLSNRQLTQIYQEYVKKLVQLRVWGWVPVFLDGLDISYLTDWLNVNFKSHLEKIKQTGEFPRYYALLSSAEKMSEIQTEELGRLDILLAIDKLKKPLVKELIRKGDTANLSNKFPYVHNLLERHLRKFNWLTYAYTGPGMSMKQLLILIKDNLRQGNPARHKTELLKHYRQVKKEKKQLIKKLKLPKELRYMFQVSAELMYIKDFRKGVYQRSYLAMDRILREIARRLKISLKAAKYLIGPEIKQALASKSLAAKYKKISSQRLRQCCCLISQGRTKVYQGAGMEKMIKQTINKISEASFSGQINAEIKELKGLTAYPGKVKALARVVLTAADVIKLKKGEIMVSSSTNPDLILAMKKSGAIVTDIGGIISHAAIVSREIKKPCIVGTKYASQIIKDGDLLEVDANAGLVKIIKRSL